MRKRLLILPLLGFALSMGTAQVFTETHNTTIVPQTLPDSTAVVYVAGDSVSAGNYGGFNLPARDKFVRRVGDRLCGVNCNKPGYPKLVDISVSATRLLTYQGVTGWQANWDAWVINAVPKPTTVLLGIGINDMGLNISVNGKDPDTTFQLAFQDVLNRSAAAGIKVIPATMFPINNHLSSYSTKYNQRYWMNQWLVNSYPVISRFDLSAKLPWNEDLDCTYENNNGGVICQTGGDGLHPNRFGVVSMADTVPVEAIV